MKKSSYFLFISILTASSFVSAGPVDDSIDKAEQLRLEAKKVGFEWNTTAPLIAKAREALSQGNTQLATELAERAIKEGQNSIKQAEYAKQHWQEFVL